MKPDPRKTLFNYARYSGIAFQMIFIILAGVFGGLKLDQWLGTKPVFIIILTLIAVFLSIYFVTKDLIKK